MPELTSLRLDADGMVWLDSPDDATPLGHVADDYRCPPGRLDEWAALFDEWAETCEEGRAERLMMAMDYYASIGALP